MVGQNGSQFSPCGPTAPKKKTENIQKELGELQRDVTAKSLSFFEVLSFQHVEIYAHFRRTYILKVYGSIGRFGIQLGSPTLICDPEQ